MIKVGIHSVPRSGSTWLGQILNSSPYVVYKYQPLFSYALKGFLNEKSGFKEIESFFERLQNIRDNFLDQQGQIESGKLPVFPKSDIRAISYKEVRYHNLILNLLQTHPSVKIIGIIRNPLSVINSWLQAPKEFRKDEDWDELEEWRYAPKKNQNKPEEFNGFEKWKEVAYLFLKLKEEYPSRFYLAKYKTLITDPDTEIKNLFEFVGLPFESQTKEFLRESTSKQIDDAYAIFRSSPSDERWKASLNPIIIEEILKDLKGTELEQFLD